MADYTTGGAAPPPDAEPAPVGWPLVERRRDASGATPPQGIERRHAEPGEFGAVPTLSTAPLWPFRLAALLGATIRALSDHHVGRASVVAATAAYAAYTAVACLRPIPYRDETRIRLRILFEVALCVALIALTGAWASPFALCLVPAGMVAGFAAGWLFSAELAAGAVVMITLRHTDGAGVVQGMRDGAVWAALLGMVAFTSGLAHRAALDSARQHQVAQARVSMLAEANSLLFSLQRVAQTLPASLDLDEVLDSTLARVESLVDSDAVAVMLFDRTGLATPIRMRGLEHLPEYEFADLPPGLQAAVGSPRPVRFDQLQPGAGVSESARSGLYAALRARSALVGLIAVEADRAAAFTQRHVEIIHGLTEPFGIAIDNARMFRQIRTMAADEERSRIARDLHDHIGSSLAAIGFEVDRAAAISYDAAKIEPVLRELRAQVSAVVAEVRETLYDLRTELTDEKDLGVLLNDYLPRVQVRSGIIATHRITIEGRVPLLQEREVWQIMREAMTNVERHSQAHHVHVVVHETEDHITAAVRDDGIGLGKAPVRVDSYGMIGMRERAANIGATLQATTNPGGGTEIRVVMQMREGSEQWD